MFAAPHRWPRVTADVEADDAPLAERRDVAGLNAVFLTIAKILFGGGAPIRRGDHTVVVVEVDQISGDEVELNHLRSALRHGFRRVRRSGGFVDDAARARDPIVFFILPLTLQGVDDDGP